MTLTEAIAARHSVRRYKHQPLPEDIVATLQAKIAECNSLGSLHIQLVTNETRAFSGPLAYGQFSGVENYFVMAGRKGNAPLSADAGEESAAVVSLDERIGYYGEQLVLLAQQLGLNTCWAGLSYRKVSQAYDLARDEKICCMIALGYGETQGASHKIKTEKDVIRVAAAAVAESRREASRPTSAVDACPSQDASTPLPSWFRQGVQAALLAPTAINQQKFYFEYIAPHGDGIPQVRAHRGFSLVGYTHMDLGIARLHFEIGAGKENFQWA